MSNQLNNRGENPQMNQFGSFFLLLNNFPFGLISADYTEFDESLTYDEISGQVCDIFREKMRDYCKKNSIDFPPIFEDDASIIILWKNVPDPVNGKVSLNRTLEMLCSPSNGTGTIYIRSVNDIINAEGIDSFIRAVSVLSEYGRVYVFLDNEYFSYKESRSFEDMEIDDKIKEMLINHLTLTSVGTVITELGKLIPKAEPEPIDKFLEIYWKWQQAEVAVDICKEELGITHRTLYKYAALYETTPYYCEHLKILNHFNRGERCIKNYAKRGELPEKEVYLTDMDSLEAGHITASDVCRKYGLSSAIDIGRVKLALTERRRKAR